MAVVEGFELLTRGYLGQDWADEYERVDDALVDFAKEEPADAVEASIEGFRALLAFEGSDDHYYNEWIHTLHAGYDPRDDGWTFREWFAHARDLLIAEKAKQQNPT